MNKEQLKQLHQEDEEYAKQQGRNQDKDHYSQKGSHKERSIANDSRKKSKRR